MTAEEFELLLERRIGLVRSVLASKAGEYASDADRLHNFKEAAALLARGTRTDLPPQTVGAALLGMLVKHWVSIQDLVRLKAAGHFCQPARIDEKIGDAINYLILLEAVLKEQP